jgi:uncharacterized protein
VQRLLVDTGALVALIRKRDNYHERICQIFSQYTGQMLTTWPVLTEVLHLVSSQAGAAVIEFVQSPSWQIVELRDAARIGELLKKYADRPIDLADASLIWAAEQTGVTSIVTTDRDFEIYRIRMQRFHCVMPL